MKKHLLLIVTALTCYFLQAQTSCVEATVVEEGTHTCETLTTEITEEISCVSNENEIGNWFVFTPLNDGEIIVTSSLSQTSGWDSHLHVFQGTCSELICIDSDDDSGTGFTSELEFEGTAGTNYYILFDNRWTTNGGDFFVGSADAEIENYIDTDNGGGGGGGWDFSYTGYCVVDMNGDFLDDIVNIEGDTVNILYQELDGTFTEGIISGPSPENGPSWSIAAGDLDGNGYNDLMYGGGSGVSILMRSDDGNTLTEWATDDYVFSQRGNMVDINNDGILDAFMCHDVEPNVYMISDGEGDFEYFQGGLGDVIDGGNYGSVWVDYNNDCLPDMFIAKCRGGDSAANINQMHRNNGDGTFTEVQDEIGLADNVQTWSSGWGDFDNDGDMDVFVGASSTSQGSHKLMRNDDGIFTDITAETGILATMPTGIEHCVHDYNNDGFIDIDISGGTVLFNNGDMTFTESSFIATNGAVGDLDNDGYLDIVSAGSGTVNYNTNEGNNFLKINLIGTETNKNGIGARITIESDLGTQIRDVRSGEGFRYMSSITAHFGLAQDETVELITVCWPSGNTTTMENIDANSTLNIVETDGTVNGVEEFLSDAFTLFPNPTSDFLNIASEKNLNSFPIEVLDLNGKVVLEKLIKDNRINLGALSTGTYIARINANGVYYQVQFVKQ